MGANTFGSYGKGLLQSHTLGLLKFNQKGDVDFGYKQGDAKTNSQNFGRSVLGALTFGTSNAQTGGGQYGDETVADSLFPKGINDAALGDRQEARGAADKSKQALIDKASTDAALQPDGADRALAASRRQGAMRLMTGRSRSNSFITSGS